MSDCIDQQGSNVKIGVAYQFVFGMPGPDVTCLVAEEFNEDGTVNCYDVHFKTKVKNIRPDKLWRPLKHTWAAWPGDVRAVTAYVGAQALDLAPKHCTLRWFMGITIKGFRSDKAMTAYELCRNCDHQSKKDLAPNESFSTSPCENCGSTNQQLYIGSDTDRPSWCKP